MSIVLAFGQMPYIKKILPLILIGFIFVCALASYGRFHNVLDYNYHVLSERSLEYRNDLRLSMRLADKIQDSYADWTISAPFLTGQTLSIPELGYVKKPLDVMIYGMPIRYGSMRPFSGLKELNIRKTLWIGLAADHSNKGPFPYPMNPKDKLIEKVRIGKNWAVLFMGGVSVEMRRIMVEHYQKQKKLGAAI